MAKVTGLKPTAKYVIGAIVIIIGVLLVKKFVLDAPKTVGESQVLSKTEMTLASEAITNPPLQDNAKLALPKFNSFVGTGTKMIIQVFAWNSQFPLMYATGGTRTSEGSLFAKYGLDVQLVWQDDSFKSKDDFKVNTQKLKDDPNETPLLYAIMGDAMPAYSVMMQDLDKLGVDGEYRVIYPMGRSNGEDGFWGPVEWRRDPKNAIGKGVAGVAKDGDVNIVIKWCADNGIPLNVNPKTYDPNALNLIPVDTYTAAGERYIAGTPETRTIVRNGKTVPDSTYELHPDSYTSWTPVDVTVAQKKGGVIRLASTKEYNQQMPNALICNRKWANLHRDAVDNLIRALGEAGDQVKSFPEAAMFAAKVSAELYSGGKEDALKERPAEYWLKYYNGTHEKDMTGMAVDLGGSKAFNLADAADMFGLGEDHKDRYKITYETFGSALTKYWGEKPSPYDKVVDKSFLYDVVSAGNTGGKAEEKSYTQDEIVQEVSNNSVSIEFDNGSAIVKPSEFAKIKEIANSATIAEGLSLGVIGHTNSVGNPTTNLALSEARARAIAAKLYEYKVSKSQLIDKNIKGVGDTRPKEGTEPADASNRRVEIILGH